MIEGEVQGASKRGRQKEVDHFFHVLERPAEMFVALPLAKKRRKKKGHARSGQESEEENPPPKIHTQFENKKVHLNKFFRTISVGFLTCFIGKRAKVRASFCPKKFV